MLIYSQTEIPDMTGGPIMCSCNVSQLQTGSHNMLSTDKASCYRQKKNLVQT